MVVPTSHIQVHNRNWYGIRQQFGGAPFFDKATHCVNRDDWMVIVTWTLEQYIGIISAGYYWILLVIYCWG